MVGKEFKRREIWPRLEEAGDVAAVIRTSGDSRVYIYFPFLELRQEGGTQ
jgi:hypothetical protein